MRSMKKEGVLKSNFVSALNLLDFQWLVVDLFKEKYMDFRSRGIDIPDDHPCNDWINEKRNEYKNGTLKDGERALLQCI